MKLNSVQKPVKYYGPIAEVCEKFVSEKKAVGYDYEQGAKRISDFSKFTASFEFPKNTLPEYVVMAYVEKRPNEAFRNRENRCSTVICLAEFMLRNDYDAFLLPRELIGKRPSRYAPYIFPHNEIIRMFEYFDGLEYKKGSWAPRRHLIMPVLFRCLYCCGLRVSEAVNLLGEDVDLSEGILFVSDAKFGKRRYVPVNNDLLTKLRKYDETRLKNPDPEKDWFFAAPDGGPYSIRSVYSIFRECLKQVGIPYKGRGKGPRLHDLRHTFAVHYLQKTVEMGYDPTTALPRLSAYMGHSNFYSTEYYLRMVAEMHPQVIEQLEKDTGYIIPSLGAQTNEKKST